MEEAWLFTTLMQSMPISAQFHNLKPAQLIKYENRTETRSVPRFSTDQSPARRSPCGPNKYSKRARAAFPNRDHSIDHRMQPRCRIAILPADTLARLPAGYFPFLDFELTLNNMKTEQKLEIYRELFGSFPEPPVGKKWVMGNYTRTSGPLNVEFKLVSDVREDGTPLSIDPLPEPPEGYRVEYIHINNLVSGEENCDKMWRFCRSELIWEDSAIDNPCRAGAHYARLYKIAQPTTLTDLVGKHGQNNVWLYCKSGSIRQVNVSLTQSERIHVDSWSVKDNAEQGKRWSNDPFTKYADANEFVV